MDGGYQYTLVYAHRAGEGQGEDALVQGGIAIISEYEIVMKLSERPDIRVVNKPIQPGVISFDLCKIDLLEEREKERFKQDPNEVPWKVFLGYQYKNHVFDKITILVPEDIATKCLK